MEIEKRDDDYYIVGLVATSGVSEPLPLSQAVAYLLESNYDAVVELLACIGLLATHGIADIGPYAQSFQRFATLAPYAVNNDNQGN